MWFQVETTEVGGIEAFVQTPAESAVDRLWLLGDLLVHVVLVVAALVSFLLPRNGERYLGGWGRIHGGVVAARFDDGHFAIVEVHHLAGMAYQRRDIGSDKHLPVADPDDDRRAISCHYDSIGLPGIDYRDAIGSVNPLEGGSQSMLQTLVRFCRNQMGESFTVGIGLEDTAVGLETRTNLGRVLDDAIVYDRDSIGRIGMWMSITVVRLTVGGPTGMTNPYASGQSLGEPALELLELPSRFVRTQTAS